ncbi:MAG: hypothetical protein KatS3mg105_4650 [Gemmatales bacterium]|nr:MAG: hypothetical protein KatS3mg105_4650 [Gemmatales bacterium]
MIRFTLKRQPTVPLEAECLSPDVVCALSHGEIRSLPVYHGKRRLRLDEFFDVDGEASADLEIHGDLSRVKWIGREMTQGKIRIVGDAGMHLGAYMKGGEIEVTGNASDWIGGEMKGGLIRIGGNAGGQIGAAYRGSRAGMNGGTILVRGSAGVEIGMRMKRGIIAVQGPVRDFAGLQMLGGTIVLLGGAEIRTGAWMKRGTIISLASIPLMPTFCFACAYVPTFLRVYARFLASFGLSLPIDDSQGVYHRYSGDTAVPGKGEILVWHPSAG